MTDHPDPVATTWSLSFEKVEQANPAAAELLRFCAFLAPDAIPEELFPKSAAELGPILEPVASDLSSLNAAIRELLKYSLVHRDPENHTLSIHRLVQEVLKDQMDDETQRLWAERAVRVVNYLLPYIHPSGPSDDQYYLPHAYLSAKLVAQWKMTFLEAANLLEKLGYYFRENYVGEEEEKAEPFLLQALEIYKQLRGSEHIDVANSLDRLAFLYRNRGKYDEAEQLHQQALVIKEKLLDPEDESIANGCNNLALIYSDSG